MFCKKLIIFVIIGILYSHTSLLFAGPSVEVTPVVLEDLVEEAIKNNPEIQAVYYNWQQEVEKLVQSWYDRKNWSNYA